MSAPTHQILIWNSQWLGGLFSQQLFQTNTTETEFAISFLLCRLPGHSHQKAVLQNLLGLYFLPFPITNQLTNPKDSNDIENPFLLFHLTSTLTD